MDKRAVTNTNVVECIASTVYCSTNVSAVVKKCASSNSNVAFGHKNCSTYMNNDMRCGFYIHNIETGTNSVGDKKRICNYKVTFCDFKCCLTSVLALKSRVAYYKIR